MRKEAAGLDKKKLVQEALNRSLSGLSEEPELARRIIAQAKGETEMKKKTIGALALAIVLGLGLLGGAYALLSSRTADFFGTHWNRELGEWLRGGRIARTEECFTAGGVTFTLDETVCRGRGIYAVGTVRAADPKDVLVPDELADAECFPEDPGARELAEAAAASGGRLLSVNVFPNKIGADGGAMLTPGCAGYYDIRNEDGSLTFSFEVEDGIVPKEGAEYRMELSVCVRQIAENGCTAEGSAAVETWNVSVKPVFEAEPSPAPLPSAEPAVWTESLGKVDVPAEYVETGTLPVFRAEETDLTAVLRPEWLNGSGVAKKRSETSLVFADRAALQFGAESLTYTRYSEEMYDYSTVQRERFHGEAEPDILPVPELSWFIADMASGVLYGYSYAEGVQQGSAELTYLTLEDARLAAEELIGKLGLKGYECRLALDMSAERIREMGEKYNRFWHESEDACTNQPRMDYSCAGPDDEGFYLVYTLMGANDLSDTRNLITLFVNRGGIAYVNLRNSFTPADVLYTPAALITPEKAVSALNAEAAASRNGLPVRSVSEVSLIYRAVRAENPADGMVFTPVWRIGYRDAESTSGNGLRWGEINAVNGELINASFR